MAALGFIGADHPISKLANTIAGLVSEIGPENKMTSWGVCVSMANACGLVLAASEGMPRDAAEELMDDLRQIMGRAYDLHDVEGEA